MPLPLPHFKPGTSPFFSAQRLDGALAVLFEIFEYDPGNVLRGPGLAIDVKSREPVPLGALPEEVPCPLFRIGHVQQWAHAICGPHPGERCLWIHLEPDAQGVGAEPLHAPGRGWPTATGREHCEIGGQELIRHLRLQPPEHALSARGEQRFDAHS
jgi:hypothetical protein